MCNETNKQTVLSAVQNNLGSISCDSLMGITGLDSSEIINALQSLAAERKVCINISPCSDGGIGHLPRSEYLFLQFKDLLDKHIACERQINFYASKLFISTKYLSAIVKKTSGKSAAYWINRQLIDIICNQLLHTSKSIKEIACGLNFSNNSSFGKYFKTQTGLSPSAYREKYSASKATAFNESETSGAKKEHMANAL